LHIRPFDARGKELGKPTCRFQAGSASLKRNRGMMQSPVLDGSAGPLFLARLLGDLHPPFILREGQYLSTTGDLRPRRIRECTSLIRGGCELQELGPFSDQDSPGGRWGAGIECPRCVLGGIPRFFLRVWGGANALSLSFMGNQKGVLSPALMGTVGVVHISLLGVKSYD